MGMFDSFLLQIDGHPLALQTKRFQQNLDQWCLGDVVDGAPSGIRVYFERQWLGADYTPHYAEIADTRPVIIFIVLVNAVFTACESVQTALEDDEIIRHIETLRTQWSDTARTMACWAQRLNERQNEIAALKHRIYRASSLIDYSRQSEDERMNSNSFLLDLKQDEEHRIDKSKNLLNDLRDILQDTLNSSSPHRFSAAPAQPASILDEFRL